MTTPASASSSGRSEGSDHTPEYHQLRAALNSLQRAATRFTGQTAAGLGRDRDTIWDAVEPWLPLAERRLNEAARSPSQQAHWRGMISAACRPESTWLPPPDLVLLLSAARCLLRALMEAERPGPSVSDIADRVRGAISNGTYPPGSLLAARPIAADVGAPTLDRVDLALQDLQREGLIDISPSKRARVAGSTMLQGPAERIAAWLRFLIQSGVFPPRSAMPSVQPLARSLVSSTPDVSSALHLLADRQVLLIQRGQRTVVHPVPPFTVAIPPELDDLALKLTCRALPNVRPTGTDILTACRQTHIWWSSRTMPAPDKADEIFGTLVNAGAHLVSQAIRQHEGAQAVRTKLRQTAVTALAERPTDRWEQIWRAACLGALVREIYQLNLTSSTRLEAEESLAPGLPRADAQPLPLPSPPSM